MCSSFTAVNILPSCSSWSVLSIKGISFLTEGLDFPLVTGKYCDTESRTTSRQRALSHPSPIISTFSSLFKLFLSSPLPKLCRIWFESQPEYGPKGYDKGKKMEREGVRNFTFFCYKTYSVKKASESERERERANESGWIGQKDREQEHQAHQITF